MFVGVGLLTAVGVGSMAGWWLILAVIFASVLAELGARLVHRVRSTMDLRRSAPLGRLFVPVDALAKLTLFSFAAQVFGRYVFPEHAVLAAMVVVIFLTLAVSLGLRIPWGVRFWVNALLLVASSVFITTGLAVSPVSDVPSSGEVGLGEIALSTAVFFPFFFASSLLSHARPTETQPTETQPAKRFPAQSAFARVGIVAMRTLLGVGVLGVALYQRGSMSLGLSSTPLRDVLAAADATALEPWLIAAVVLATLPVGAVALSQAARELREQLPPPRSRGNPVFLLGVAAIVLVLAASRLDSSALLRPSTLLWLSAAMAVSEIVLVSVLATASRYRR